MITQLQQDTRILPQIYELATSHGVGIPLKKHTRRLLQIILVLWLLTFLCMVGFLCYNVYGYIAFILLSHTYPDINSVPPDQLDNYIWLQVLHDSLFTWRSLQIVVPLFTIITQFSTFYPPYQTKLYICTDGLLKIYKKNVETIRWDEIKEVHTTGGNVTTLVKQDDCNFELPRLLMAGSRKTTSALIADEVTRCLLPGLLVNYERGEVVRFRDLQVSQKGIYWPGGMVYWKQLGDVTLEKGRLSAYYLDFDKVHSKKDQIFTTSTGKWHIWLASDVKPSSNPNLAVFVALVNHILDQRGAEDAQETPLPLKEIARVVKYKDQRRKRVKIAILVTSILCVCSLLVSFPVYQSINEQQRADRDAQLVRNYINMRAHKPYYAPVPGQHCDHGKVAWLDDDSENVYTCQQDGLLMTQKDMQYQDGEYFSFMPDYQWAYGHYIPHHYSVQVKATIISGGPGTCVSLQVHIQDFQGRQEFDVCADGSWSYSQCDLHCNTDTQVTNGQLPYAKNAYLIAVDVTDSILMLSVNKAEVVAVQDTTYSSTDQIEFGLYGDHHARQPISALFSDFLYTPYA